MCCDLRVHRIAQPNPVNVTKHRGSAIYPYRNPLVQTDLPQPDAETKLVLNHQTGRYNRLGPREFDWLHRLDGQTRQEDVAALLGQEPALTEELLRRLEAAKLIVYSPSPVTLVPQTQAVQLNTVEKTVEWAQFGQLRIRIPQPDRLLKALLKIRLLRSRIFIALTIWIAVLGIAVSIRLLQLAGLTALLRNVTWHPWDIAALITLLFVTTAIHELGHALVCTSYGAPVRSMGFMLYYLQPAAFADITDSWRLTNKWHRVAISAAGVYVQAGVNAIAVAALLIIRATGRRTDLLLLYIALNLFTMAFNLIPFVKLDGYWMLSAALSIPNLRDRAVEWWRAFVTSKVTRRAVNGKSLRFNAVLLMSPMGRSLLACFGASSMAFGTSMWMGGLSFMFRVARWLGLRTGSSYFFVGGLLLAGGIAFAVRWRRAQRQPSQAAPALVPTSAFAVKHDIDPNREIRLNPFLTVLDEENGTVIFGWTTEDQLSVQGVKGIFDWLPSLRKGIKLSDWDASLSAMDSQTEEILQQLWHLKQLRYSEDWELREEEKRYSRQLGWMSLNTSVRGAESETLALLKTKTIALLGVGGVGSNVAINLAACGIGAIHLVDGDDVELTNLNRQLLYTPKDIGRPKVEVAAEKLAEFDPELSIRTTNKMLKSVQDVMEVIQGADFVIRALDTPVEAQMWVNEACMRMGIPCTGAGFMAQGAVVGPTVIPGVTACLACHQKATLPRLDRGAGASFAPVVTMCAGILSNEVITYLARLGRLKTASGIVVIEAPTFSTRAQEYLKDANCKICGTTAEVAV